MDRPGAGRLTSPADAPLPRAVESDPRALVVRAALSHDTVALWRAATIVVPRVALSPALASALAAAWTRGQVMLGLERAAAALAAERAGLDALAARGTDTGARVSRLLVLADDGAERFYREAERLVLAHAPRVLPLRCAADAVTLGRAVLGRDRAVKAVLATHRTAVAELLFALVA